ncbi:MAG: UDP-3-O-(3-hydroxymyristoyl)glucosamine N-acyltransferase [Phycisphaerae bacterium]|nr:UDP-3-O-(3-hydroxymyristoyl)glucosamine N-acyltransferase [Phycisphaerae bacterium]
MARTLAQLAQLVSGKVVGDASVEIVAVNTLEAAGPNEISFLSNPKYQRQLQTTRAGAVIVSRDYGEAPHAALLQVDDPYFAFRQVMVEVYGFRRQPGGGVHRLANVSPTATLGEGVTVCPFATVEAGATVGPRTVLYPNAYVGENATVGADCVLHANVVVYDRCILGDRVTLHAGTVIGQDGFGYATHGGLHQKIPQIGIARVCDDVEMGANCAVDRATLGETVIGKGTKFSDLVAIGHGTVIGEHCLLVAQVGIAGSVTLGKYCVLAGQVGIAGHLKIGDQVTMAAKSGVINDIPSGQTILGQPAIEINKAKKNYVAFVQLAELREKVRQMERRLAELEGRK